MRIYVDHENKCYADEADGRTVAEVALFDGKCNTFIEGYCYKHTGGEISIYPYKPFHELASAQEEKEKEGFAKLGALSANTSFENAVQQVRHSINFAATKLSDAETLTHRILVEEWANETPYEVGSKCTYNTALYKCVQAHTAQESWAPNNAPALWQRIDETHAGTREDPIPYHINMEVFAGLFYTEEDILYRCIQNSGMPLQHPASALVGIYFSAEE